MDFKLLKEISCKNELIITWKFIEIENRCIRIYYKESNEIGLGFDFYVVEQVCIISGDEDFGDSSEVECIYNGIAYFDGIRHLYMGDDATGNFGYDYYARLDNHILVLKELLKLEHKFCRDVDSTLIQ